MSSKPSLMLRSAQRARLEARTTAMQSIPSQTLRVTPPSELEKGRQIADCRSVCRGVRIGGIINRIGEMIAASRRQGREPPVRLNEFEYRNVVGVGMVNSPFFGEG